MSIVYGFGRQIRLCKHFRFLSFFLLSTWAYYAGPQVHPAKGIVLSTHNDSRFNFIFFSSFLSRCPAWYLFSSCFPQNHNITFWNEEKKSYCIIPERWLSRPLHLIHGPSFFCKKKNKIKIKTHELCELTMRLYVTAQIAFFMSLTHQFKPMECRGRTKKKN